MSCSCSVSMTSNRFHLKSGSRLRQNWSIADLVGVIAGKKHALTVLPGLARDRTLRGSKSPCHCPDGDT